MNSQEMSPESEDPPSAPSRAARPWRRGLLVFLLVAVVAVALLALVQRVLGPADPFGTYTLPYLQDFSGDIQLRRWFSSGGAWSIREQRLVQTVNADAPAMILIPQRLIPDQPYHARVDFTVSDKATATGILFNAQEHAPYTTHHRVLITRSDDGALDLDAGYTGDDGDFIGQISVPYASDSSQYRLDLFVFANTYSVHLNGQALIERRPLMIRNGLLGFVTVGPASISRLQVTAAADERADPLVYRSDFDRQPAGAGGWVPFSGEWQLVVGELLQLNTQPDPAGIGYEAASFSDAAYELRVRHLQGLGGGLLFNLPSPYQINGGHVVRFAEEADVLVWGYYDDSGRFNRQGFAPVDAAQSPDRLLTVYAGASTYDVYLDRRLISREIPLVRVDGYIGLVTVKSSAAFAEVNVFPLLLDRQIAPSIRVEQARPPPSEASAPSPDAVPVATPLPPDSALIADRAFVAGFQGDLREAGWRILSGDWRFETGRLLQARRAGFDMGAVYTRQAFREPVLEVELAHLAGSGAGLLFNMPYRDRLQGAHMVRYSDRRDNAVFWGYYNAEGTFVGQGYADVLPANQSPQRLRVVAGADTYAVFLNGELITAGIPLQQPYGHIGLVTSQSSAAFSVVSVNDRTIAAPAEQAAQPTPTARVLIGRPADRGGVTGGWSVSDDRIGQAVTAPGDYIFTTATYAARFSVDVTVDLSEAGEGSGVGGGILFHMPEPHRRHGASMVRLINGGERVFWGVFGEDGSFAGRGSYDLSDLAGPIYHLRLAVNGDKYDLYVNDTPVLLQADAPAGQGWIGLIAHGGAVEFSGLNIQVEEGP